MALLLDGFGPLWSYLTAQTEQLYLHMSKHSNMQIFANIINELDAESPTAQTQSNHIALFTQLTDKADLKGKGDMRTELFLANELGSLVLPALSLLMAALKRDKSRAKVLLIGQLVAFALAFLGLLVQLTDPTAPTILLGRGALSWRFDLAGSCLLAGITFIASVVMAYSERYLAGEQSRLKFLCFASFLSSCASVLVTTDSLIVAFCGWHLLSLGLWATMRLQEPSRKSARVVLQHHLVSDTALLLGLASVYGATGVLQFSQLPAVLPSLGRAVGQGSLDLPLTVGDACSLLLVLAFSIKSALFPFHKWLLATLEAPTPLSGLLHAGVVNVAAIMAWRMMPMLQQHPPILLMWGALAALSSVIGTLSMSAQPDVKKKLVYSTVGQMGFMSLQCASGAIAAALFHMLAHGLFKCHMFLQSGSAVADGLNKKKFGQIDVGQSSSKGDYQSSFFIVALSIAFSVWLGALCPNQGLTGISTVIAACALFCAMPVLQRVKFSQLVTFWLVVLTFALPSLVASSRFEQSIPNVSAPTGWLLPLCMCLFALVSILMQIWRRSSVAKALYVHSLNGFYI